MQNLFCFCRTFLSLSEKFLNDLEQSHFISFLQDFFQIQSVSVKDIEIFCSSIWSGFEYHLAYFTHCFISFFMRAEMSANKIVDTSKELKYLLTEDHFLGVGVITTSQHGLHRKVMETNWLIRKDWIKLLKHFNACWKTYLTQIEPKVKQTNTRENI